MNLKKQRLEKKTLQKNLRNNEKARCSKITNNERCKIKNLKANMHPEVYRKFVNGRLYVQVKWYCNEHIPEKRHPYVSGRGR